MLYRPAYWADDPSYYESDVILTYDKDGTFTTYGWQDDIQSFTRQGAASNGLMDYDNKELWELIPEIDDVAPEIFDYDSENDVYVCCDELVAFIGSECFIPLLDVDPEFNGYGTNCEIKLGEDGNIETITVVATVNNSFQVAQIEYVLEFTNIGTTTLPSDAILVI